MIAPIKTIALAIGLNDNKLTSNRTGASKSPPPKSTLFLQIYRTQFYLEHLRDEVTVNAKSCFTINVASSTICFVIKQQKNRIQREVRGILRLAAHRVKLQNYANARS